jgi:restriction endonuclease S subunit
VIIKTRERERERAIQIYDNECDCIPWYDGGDINAQTLNPKKKITRFAVQENKNPLTTENTILYSNVRYIQPLFLNKANISCNEGVFLLEPDLKLVNPNWLTYCLLANQDKLYKLRSGTTFPSLTKSSFASFQIFIPSLEYQNQIIDKFKIVYNQIFKTEINYYDNLQKIVQLYLSIGDLLFQKHIDSKIKIKDEFKLIAGKTPPTKKNEYFQNGKIKWINSGVLTNLYFLTEHTKASKLVTGQAVQESKLNYAKQYSVLISDIGLNEKKIVWVYYQNDKNNISLCGTHVWNLYGTDNYKNATLFFSLRKINFKKFYSGAVINMVQRSELNNLDIDWVLNQSIQKKLYILLNSPLVKIKELHIKIKELLLLKYFSVHIKKE